MPVWLAVVLRAKELPRGFGSNGLQAKDTGEIHEQEMLQKEPVLQELPAPEKEVKPEIGYKQASQSYRPGFWLR